METELTPKLLHSAHVFMLRTPTRVYIWCGKASLPSEYNTALAAAKILEPKQDAITHVKEESEPAEFWEALGVKGGNISAPRKEIYMHVAKSDTSQRYQPRLFLCSTGSGRFEVEEESSFSQENLVTEGAAILDIFDVIYVWLGKRSPHNIRKTAMELAIEYVKQAPYKHASSTPVQVVEPFSEPVCFKASFRAWSYAKYPKQKPIEEATPLPVNQVLQHYLREVYSYEELLSDPMPPGVDRRKLETYLTDDDFGKVFQMSRAEFEKIPPWKRENLKRDVFLY